MPGEGAAQMRALALLSGLNYELRSANAAHRIVASILLAGAIARDKRSKRIVEVMLSSDCKSSQLRAAKSSAN